MTVFKNVIFYSILALAAIIMLGVPSLFYALAGDANFEWIIALLMASNLPSIAGTLMSVFLIMFKKQLLGAPWKQ